MQGASCTPHLPTPEMRPIDASRYDRMITNETTITTSPPSPTSVSLEALLITAVHAHVSAGFASSSASSMPSTTTCPPLKRGIRCSPTGVRRPTGATAEWTSSSRSSSEWPAFTADKRRQGGECGSHFHHSAASITQ